MQISTKLSGRNWRGLRCGKSTSHSAAIKRAKRGETLVETLVAVLIAGLAIAMLAMAIGVSARIVRQSDDAAEGYYAASNALVEAAGGTAGSVQVTDFAGTTQSVSVTYNTSEDSPGGGDVVAYKAD